MYKRQLLKEDSSIVGVLTKEKGCIDVFIQASEKSTSKMAPFTQLGDYCEVEMIRAREYFRMVGARHSRPRIESSEVVHILTLIDQVRRLVEKETPEDDLFNLVHDFYQFILNNEGDSVLVESASMAYQLEVMKVAGYAKKTSNYLSHIKRGISCGEKELLQIQKLLSKAKEASMMFI